MSNFLRKEEQKRYENATGNNTFELLRHDLF